MAEFSRSRISRQFTDSEKAVDDRIDSHLTAPPIQLDITAGVGAGYKWLQEDLAMRSTLSKQLAGEQAMAYAQSERRALSEQARLQEAQDQAALNGVARARMLLESGQAKDAKHARQIVFGENQDLYINPVADKVFGDLEATFESPEMRELRQRKMDFDLVSANNSLFGARVTNQFNEYVGEEKAAERLALHFNRSRAKEDNDALVEDVRKITLRKQLRDAEDMQRVFSAMGGSPEDASARRNAYGALADMGLADVDVDAVAPLISKDPVLLGMLADPVGRDQIFRTPEEKAIFAQSLNAMGVAAPGSPEHNEARKIVDIATYQWEKATRSQRAAVESVKVAHEVGKEFGDAWESTYKAIDGVMRDKDMKNDKQKQSSAMLGHYFAFLSNATGLGQDIPVAERVKQVQAMQKEIQDKKSKITPEQVRQFILNDQLMFGAEHKQAMIRSRLGKGVMQQAAKAVDAAAPLQPGDVRDGYKFKGGNPADKANWEKQ